MRHLVTLLCLVAAVASYIVGSTSGAVVFLALGVLLEGVFWFRIIGRKPGT